MLVGGLTIITMLFGAGKAFDQHYEKAADANQRFAQMAEDQEQARLETELKIKELELNQLRSKSSPTDEDMDQMTYLKTAIVILRQRLEGLSK